MKKVGSKACSNVKPHSARRGGSIRTTALAPAALEDFVYCANRLHAVLQLAAGMANNFDVVVSLCMVEKQEHTRTRESHPSLTAFNPKKKESACVSVAAVRAKIE